MRTFLLSFVIILSVFSCKEPIPVVLDCTGDCLFTKIDETGVVSYTDCYQKWSITFDSDSLQAIIIDPDSELQVKGLELEVSGILFENDYPFLMPDPPGPIQHKIEIRTFRILN